MTRRVIIDGNDPADGVTSSLTIGGGTVYQDLSVTTTIGGEELHPTELTIETNRYAETATAEVTGVWQTSPLPSSGDQLTVDINGIRVFTGTIERPAPKEGDLITITAFDLVKQLLRTRITQQFRQASLQYIAQWVAEAVDAPIEFEFPVDVVTSPSYSDTPGTQVLDQVAKWGDVVWWVDAENIIHVGPPEPTVHEFGPEFIEANPTAGKKEPPYRRVIVQGEDAASRPLSGGLNAVHMLAKNSIAATAGDGEPTYTYRSKQIRTQTQAEQAATAILKEFKRQRAEGTIAIIGEGAPIRPFDVISLPAELNHEQYLVSGVKHTFTNGDGFITDINCGGLINGA